MKNPSKKNTNNYSAWAGLEEKSVTRAQLRREMSSRGKQLAAIFAVLLFLLYVRSILAFDCTKVVVDSLTETDPRFSVNACIIINEFTPIDCSKVKDLFVDSSVKEAAPCPGYGNVVSVATNISGTQIQYTQLEDAVLNCPFDPVLIEFYGTLYMTNATDFIYPRPYDFILRGIPLVEYVPPVNVTSLVPVPVTVFNATLGVNVTTIVLEEQVTSVIPEQYVSLQSSIVGFQNLQVVYENVSVTFDGWLSEGCGTTNGLFLTQACPEYCGVDDTNYCSGSWFNKNDDVVDNSICMQTSAVFNGSTSLYLLPTNTSSKSDSASVQFQLQEFTLEAWINPSVAYAHKDTVVVGNHAYDVSSTGSIGYGFVYTKTTPQESSGACTSISFVVTVDGASTNDLICPLQMAPNIWQHLAGSYSQTNGMKFYVNGVLVCTKPAPTKRAPDYDAVRPFRLGAGYDSSNLRHFTGQIDDVRLWNYVRTDSEIATYYSVPLNSPNVGLILYFPFDIDSPTPFVNKSPFTTLPTWTEYDGDISSLPLTLVYDCMCITIEDSCVPSKLYYEQPSTAVTSILSTDNATNYEFIRGKLIDPNGNYGILWLPGTTMTTGPFYDPNVTFIPGIFVNNTGQPIECPKNTTGNSTEVQYTQTFVPGANPVNLPVIGQNPWGDPMYDFFMPGWFVTNVQAGGAYLASNFYPGIFVPVSQAPPNPIGQLLGCTAPCNKTFVAGIQWPNGTFTPFPFLSQYSLIPMALGGFCWNDDWPDECVIPDLPVVPVATVPELQERYNCTVSDTDVEPVFLDPRKRDPCFMLREISMAMGGEETVNGTGCDLSGDWVAPAYLNPLERNPCSIARALVAMTNNGTTVLNCSDGTVPLPPIDMPCLRNQNLTILDMVVQNYYGEKVVCMHSCDELSSAVIENTNFTGIPGSALYLTGMENFDIHNNVFCPCGGMTEGCVVLASNMISTGEFWFYNNRHCAVEDLLPYTCSYPLTPTLYCEAGTLLCLDVPATLDVNCIQVEVSPGVYYFDNSCAIYTPCQCGSEDQVISLPDGTNVTYTSNTGDLSIDIAFLTPLIADITGGEPEMNVSCAVTTAMVPFNYTCTVYENVTVTIGNVTTTTTISYTDICTIDIEVRVGVAEALSCGCPRGYNNSFSTNLTGSQAANALGIYSTCEWSIPGGLSGEECLNGVVQCPYAGGTLGSGAPPPVTVGKCANGTVTLDCEDCVGGQQYYETGMVACPGSCSSNQYFTASCQCLDFSLVVPCSRDVTCIPPVPCSSFTNITLCGYTGSLMYDGTSYPCFVEENATLCTGYNYASQGATPPDGFMRMPCDNTYVLPSPGPCSCSSIISSADNTTVACTNTTVNSTCNGGTPSSVQTGYSNLQLTCNTDGTISCRCDGAQAISALTYNGSSLLNTSAAYVFKYISVNASWYQQNNVAQQLPYGWRFIQFLYDLIQAGPLLVLGWFSDKAVLYESSRLSPLITGTVADWADGYDSQWNFRTCNMLDPGPDEGVLDNECKQYRPLENTSCVVDSTYEERITNDYGVSRFNRINDAMDKGCNVIVVHKSLNAYHERLKFTEKNVWVGSYDSALIIAAGHGIYTDGITLRGLVLQHTNAISFPLIEPTPVSSNPFDTDFTDAPDDAGLPDTFRVLNCVLDGANVDKAGAVIGLFGKEFVMLYNTIQNFHTRAVYIQSPDVEARMNTFVENHGRQFQLIEGQAFTFEENLALNPKGKKKANNLELFSFKCKGDYGPIVKQDIGTLDFASYTAEDYITLFDIESALENIDPKGLGCNPSYDDTLQCYIRGNRIIYDEEASQEQRSTVGYRVIGGNITANRFIDNTVVKGQIGADFTYTPSINYLNAAELSSTNALIRVEDSFSMKGKTGADWCFRPPGSLVTVCCFYPNCWPNTTFPVMEINPQCKLIDTPGYGFLCMNNLTDGARYGYPMEMLNVTSRETILRNEVLQLASSVYAVGYPDAYCCARPIIYGASHQLAASEIILQYLEFRFKVNTTENDNVAEKMFETPAGFLPTDIQFWDVNFDGRGILGDGKIKIASIHIDPTTGIFALRESRIYGWWHLPDDARRGFIASNKGSVPIIAFNDNSEYFFKTRMPSVEGFYIYFQLSENLDTSPFVSGSKSNPQFEIQSSAIIKDNVFRDLDGNVLTITQPGNWEITGNQVLDCGVRQPFATSCFFLNGNQKSTGDYIIEDNLFETKRNYLCPWGGGRNNRVEFAALRIEGLLYPRIFLFRNITVVKNGRTDHYPIVQQGDSSGRTFEDLDWGWFKTAGPRVLNAPYQIEQTPEPNDWDAAVIFDRDVNRNHIITGGNANEATLIGDEAATDNYASYGDPVQALLGINAEGKIYTYPIEDNTTGYPFAVQFNLPPQILVQTLDPTSGYNLSYFGGFADQFYPLRIVAVESGFDAAKLLSYGNISRPPSNGPGLRGITSDIVLCSTYKNILQSGFQQCTVCNSGCPIPLPTECRVDPANATFVSTNPYFKSWLFMTLHDALLGCKDVRRKIVVARQPFPYTDTWNFDVGNWTITSDDDAEVLVSSPVTIYADNISIRGIKFIHAAGIFSPTMRSSNTLHGRPPANITLRHCSFNGTGIKQSAILGSFSSLSLLGVKYTGYQPVSSSVVELTSQCGMLFVQNNVFADAKYSALTAYNYDAYTLHKNRFRHCGRNATVDRPYCMKITACYNSSTRIVFTHNKHHETGYRHVDGRPYVTAFWLDTLPFLEEKNSANHLPHIDLSFNSASGLDIGLRVTNVEDTSQSKWIRNRDTVSKLSVGFRNQDVRGNRYYIVWGEPSDDALIDQDPEARQHYWCNNDCSSGNQYFWLVIIVSSIACFIVLWFLAICCCCLEPPSRRQYVDGVWITTGFRDSRNFD